MEAEYIVVGAGVIGLAIARAFAEAGKEVIVLEKNSTVGEEISFRNSAVIHAGIYYPPQSLKAKLCREGQDLLYQYCQSHDIACKKIGKLIVATKKSQIKKLAEIAHIAKTNGVSCLVRVGSAELIHMAPHIHAIEGLYSPSTGILDVKSLLRKLLKDIMSSGKILYQTRFLTGKVQQDKIIVKTSNEKFPTLTCRYLINSAGLGAWQVANNLCGLASNTIPKAYYAKGNYFKLKGKSPFSTLIYPLPEQAGLGIHATTDLNGITRFGPDVEWIKKINYAVSLARQAKFYREIRKYYPGLENETLVPEFAGIRPKITSAKEQPQDFLIQDYRLHGIKNLINLYGMESPGLTASLAIANYVKQLLQ